MPKNEDVKRGVQIVLEHLSRFTMFSILFVGVPISAGITLWSGPHLSAMIERLVPAIIATVPFFWAVACGALIGLIGSRFFGNVQWDLDFTGPVLWMPTMMLTLMLFFRQDWFLGLQSVAYLVAFLIAFLRRVQVKRAADR